MASLSPYWLQMKLSMSLFFYLFTFAINLRHRKFVTADVTAVFVNNEHGIQRRKQDFEKFVFEKLYSKEGDRQISHGQSCVYAACPLNSRLIINCLNVFFSVGTARCVTAWPLVYCPCVLQLFQLLINSMLCPAFLRKFVCQPLCCTPLQIQSFYQNVVHFLSYMWNICKITEFVIFQLV